MIIRPPVDTPDEPEPDDDLSHGAASRAATWAAIAFAAGAACFVIAALIAGG